MTVEDQLREYRATLDAATEDAAAQQGHRATPPVRIHPTRTLVLAAVAVAATIAIAFAAVGLSRDRSTPPATVGTTTTTSVIGPVRTVVVPDVVGMKAAAAEQTVRRLDFLFVARAVSCNGALGVVTKQEPLAGRNARRGSTITLTVCTTRAAGLATTLPLVGCDTLEGQSPGPTERPPTSLTITAPPFDQPTLSGYSDSHGRLPITAPAGWHCKAIDATDGGTGVGVTPPGTAPKDSWGIGSKPTLPLADGVFGMSDPACQGCVYGEVCGIVPTADADFPSFAGSGLCATPPPGQQVTALGNNLYAISDPAGTIGLHEAHSILRYTPRTATSDASVIRETCILSPSQRAVCDALLAEFLALHPAPEAWTSAHLTLTPTSLGAVRVGMSVAEAQRAAGAVFDGSGDGFRYPRTYPAGFPHDFVGLGGVKGTVICVGASIWQATTGTQTISTPEAFRLGDTVQKLLAIYGSRAHFVAAPPSGITTNAGYTVDEAGGRFAFVVDLAGKRVVAMAGGDRNLGPNSCTG